MALSASISAILPAGDQWLTSDVVDIEGVPSDLTFAMQMSFDDGINTFWTDLPGRLTVVGLLYCQVEPQRKRRHRHG